MQSRQLFYEGSASKPAFTTVLKRVFPIWNNNKHWNVKTVSKLHTWDNSWDDIWGDQRNEQRGTSQSCLWKDVIWNSLSKSIREK